MTDTNLQGNVLSPDADASRQAGEKFLPDVEIVLPSDASTQLTTPKESAALMSLPGELRNHIYRYYFAPQGTTLDGQGERRIHHMHPDNVDHLRVNNLRLNNTDVLVAWANPISGRMLDINLLFTCKQVFDEARGIFFEERLVQVQMHGHFDRYVEQALRWALRLELCMERGDSWWPARPSRFVGILEARDDLKEFAFRVGKHDPALNDSRVVQLPRGVLGIKASKSVSLIWTGAEETFSSRIGEYRAVIRSIEEKMIRG